MTAANNSLSFGRYSDSVDHNDYDAVTQSVRRKNKARQAQPAATVPFSTYDVDAIAEIASYAEYVNFSARLRELGFKEDTSEGAPICRWIHEDLKLDVMPMDDKILGFSNRWYAEAIQHAVSVSLSDDLAIRVVTAPYFLATKLEAFKGRGNNDYFASHDLEDLDPAPKNWTV